MYANYASLFFKSAVLAFEAQQVIALRMMRFAAGGTLANREFHRMFSEKASAAFLIGTAGFMQAAMGKSNEAIATKAIRSYTTRVRQNRRRLTK